MFLLGKPCWNSMTSLLSQFVCQSEASGECVFVCALPTKTVQHYSRLSNYGHNAGLSCKSSLQQKHTRTEDNNYPSQIMRLLNAQSRLSKHTDDRNGRAPGLQGVNEIYPNRVMTTTALQKLHWRVTVTLMGTIWLVSANVLECQSHLLHYSSCIGVPPLPLSWLMQWCQSHTCLSLQVTLLTESSRRLTSFPQVDYRLLMWSVSQPQLLVPPTVLFIQYPLRSMYRWIRQWYLQEPTLDVGSHWGGGNSLSGAFCHFAYAGVWKG